MKQKELNETDVVKKLDQAMIKLEQWNISDPMRKVDRLGKTFCLENSWNNIPVPIFETIKEIVERIKDLKVNIRSITHTMLSLEDARSLESNKTHKKIAILEDNICEKFNDFVTNAEAQE